MFARLSMLWFYRLKFTTKLSRCAATWMLPANLIFGIASVVAQALLANPVSEAWNPNQHDDWRFSPRTFYVASSTISVILDIILLLLPLLTMHHLRLSAQRKLHIALIFVLGSLCILTIAVRSWYFWRIFYAASTSFESGKAYTSISQHTIWMTVETAMVLITLNLPTYTHLLQTRASNSEATNSLTSIFNSSNNNVTSTTTIILRQKQSSASTASAFSGTETTTIHMPSNTRTNSHTTTKSDYYPSHQDYPLPTQTPTSSLTKHQQKQGQKLAWQSAQSKNYITSITAGAAATADASNDNTKIRVVRDYHGESPKSSPDSELGNPIDRAFSSSGGEWDAGIDDNDDDEDDLEARHRFRSRRRTWRKGSSIRLPKSRARKEKGKKDGDSNQQAAISIEVTRAFGMEYEDVECGKM